MPLNLELRFRLDDAARVEGRLRSIASGAPEAVDQEDTFFDVRKGRLLLRKASGSAELIFYSRADVTAPRPAAYFRHSVDDPEAAEARLVRRFGVRRRVRKHRRMFNVATAQVCIDDVNELGSFLDVRVPILGAGDLPKAHAVVKRVVTELGLDDSERIPKDYDELIDAKVQQRH